MFLNVFYMAYSYVIRNNKWQNIWINICQTCVCSFCKMKRFKISFYTLICCLYVCNEWRGICMSQLLVFQGRRICFLQNAVGLKLASTFIASFHCTKTVAETGFRVSRISVIWSPRISLIILDTEAIITIKNCSKMTNGGYHKLLSHWNTSPNPFPPSQKPISTKICHFH